MWVIASVLVSSVMRGGAAAWLAAGHCGATEGFVSRDRGGMDGCVDGAKID